MNESEEKGNLLEKPMVWRAEEALKKAVARVLADHKRTGDPVVVWRAGNVVKIPADQIGIRESESEYETPIREDK